jgi:hypothetical protein
VPADRQARIYCKTTIKQAFRLMAYCSGRGPLNRRPLSLVRSIGQLSED